MAKGPKSITPAKATSSFKGVQNYNVGLDGLGSANTSQSGNTVTTNSQLSPGLQPIQSQAIQGLSGNQQYLNQTPDQQYHNLVAGQNPYYNALKAQSDLNYQNQYNALQNRFSSNGLVNSTAFGAFAGQQARDANLVDTANQVSALEQQNQTAQNNAALHANVLNQLAGYQSGLGQLTNQDLFAGNTAQDQISLANAQLSQDAAKYNSQAAAQRSAATGSLIGNILGTVGSIAAIPFTGGTSALGLIPSLGGAASQGFGSSASQYGGGMSNLSNYFPQSAYSSGPIPSLQSQILGRTF